MDNRRMWTETTGVPNGKEDVIKELSYLYKDL